MSTPEIVLTAVSSISAGSYGLVRYWLRLRFLRETFERNGDRKDLETAGKVTAPGWLIRGERPDSNDAPAGVRPTVGAGCSCPAKVGVITLLGRRASQSR